MVVFLKLYRSGLGFREISLRDYLFQADFITCKVSLKLNGLFMKKTWKKMVFSIKKIFFVLFFLFLSVVGCESKSLKNKSFRLHLFQEPSHLDPARLSGNSSSYFFYNILRGLYRIDRKNRLVPEAGRCQWIDKKNLDCFIESFWSSGEPVIAMDFVRSFRHLVDPETASPRSHLLKNLKNAGAIMGGQKPVSELGVKALSPEKLRIELDQPDPEFFYKLSSTALFPTHKNTGYDKKDFKKFLGNGPYKINFWNFGKNIKLQPNPFYKKGHRGRPEVELLFIDNEMTAYRLYLNSQLDFLRRVPSHLISHLRDRKDFYQIPVARFDYIGFGPGLMKDGKLRQALIHSIDYKNLKDLLKALGRPGCPGLPSDWMDRVPCYEFNPQKAKRFLKESQISKITRPLKLKISQLGGEDIKKQGEFFQNQWKIHLGLEVQIFQMDQKSFLEELRVNPPDIFRKGVKPDHPTCLNTLEIFNTDNRMGFLHGSDAAVYGKILKTMSKESPGELYRKMCRQAVEKLMDEAFFIPLGEIHFSLLVSSDYEGWTLNLMNQLDLGGLHRK